MLKNKRNIMIMSHTIHCNTIKSHNTVCAHTALLKAAELVLLVLMEAGSTMKRLEIQANFNKSLYRASPSGCYLGLVF